MESDIATLAAPRPPAAALDTGSGSGTSAASVKSTPDFTDFDLRVGAAMELRRVGLDESRYATELIGFVRNVCIIVKMPVADGKLVLVREGQPVVMRAFFSGTDALSFSTNVIAARFSPEAYLHLKYPAEIASATVRKQRRVEVDLIASSAAEGMHARPAIVLDLSASGARLAIPASLGDVGTRVRITFRLQTPTGPATLDLDALVCNVKRDDVHNRFLHGVKFVDVEPLHALALRGYIASARRRREPGLSR